MRYFVCSGDHHWSIEENDQREAALSAFNELASSLPTDKLLGKLTMVSEHGFGGDAPDDMFFCTLDLLESTNQLNKFVSLEWSNAEEIEDKPMPY